MPEPKKKKSGSSRGPESKESLKYYDYQAQNRASEDRAMLRDAVSMDRPVRANKAHLDYIDSGLAKQNAAAFAPATMGSGAPPSGQSGGVMDQILELVRMLKQ
jgi:hypothetical protein